MVWGVAKGGRERGRREDSRAGEYHDIVEMSGCDHYYCLGMITVQTDAATRGGKRLWALFDSKSGGTVSQHPSPARAARRPFGDGIRKKPGYGDFWQVAAA